MFWSKLFCGNPIFWPFCYAGSWEEVKKVEEVHGDEAEEKGKEKSVDACGGSDDDIHGGISSETCRCFVALKFCSQKSFLSEFPCNCKLSIQNLTFWRGAESRKKHLEFCYWFNLKREKVVLQMKIFGGVHLRRIPWRSSISGRGSWRWPRGRQRGRKV